MASKLVIVESPAKARTISRYLGKGYEVKASGGHVRDLPEDEFGVDVRNGFEPTYRVIKGRQRTVSGLKKSSQKAEEVYLAPDPDREGEAIAWHLAELLELPEEKLRRATFQEITREAVREAFESPRGLDMNLVNAQQARRILDRIVGYELSPLISRKVARGLSAGRVQSVALRLVVEREREIEAFEPEEYWELMARLARAGQQEAFEAKLASLDGEKPELHDRKAAQAAVERLKGVPYRVRSVKTARRQARPAPPFITSTLQQAASSKLGMTPTQTMRVAQQLYEGVELHGQSEGLITYMRTDSTRVAERALAAVRELVRQQFGEQYLPPRPNTYKNPAGAQAAHEAIRPTDVRRTPESLKGELDKRQWQLYELIWRRFVASQMRPAVYEVTTVEAEAGPGVFLARGRRMLFDGFIRVLPPEKGPEAEQSLPELREGEELELRELEPTQHFTQPPPRYTEATLVRELERRGIGRPSTYAPTVATLLRRNYVRRHRRALVPTDLGRVVVDKLLAHFPREVDYDFTKRLEAKLDRIEQGKADWRQTLAEFYRTFSRDLERAKTAMTSVAQDEEHLKRVCEKCGREMVVRFTRRGDRFLGCTGYPECDNTVPLSPPQGEPTEHRCPECGSPMLLRRGRRGRAYLACSAYPECRRVMGLDADGNPVEMRPRSRTGLRCARCGAELYLVEEGEERLLECGRCRERRPLVSIEDALAESDRLLSGLAPCEECGAAVVLRRSKKGLFLGCSRYPECKATRPLARDELPAPIPTVERCDRCGQPMALRWGRFGRFLSCSNFPRCRNLWRLPSNMRACPRDGCDGHLVEKVTPDGARVLGCTRFPECDYTEPRENREPEGG